MDLAPPPAPASRVQELGDRLIVWFRPPRSWGGIAFLTFFLSFWTFGGIAALHALPGQGWGGRAFIVVWLCGWLFGECVVTVGLAWQMRGRGLLIVTPERFEVRQEVGRFARTKSYDVPLVEDVEAARVPAGEDESPRKDYCLKVAYNGKPVRIGEGMGEREAEYVATAVLSRIRPRTSWSEEKHDDPFSPARLGRLGDP